MLYESIINASLLKMCVALVLEVRNIRCLTTQVKCLFFSIQTSFLVTTVWIDRGQSASEYTS